MLKVGMWIVGAGIASMVIGAIILVIGGTTNQSSMFLVGGTFLFVGIAAGIVGWIINQIGDHQRSKHPKLW